MAEVSIDIAKETSVEAVKTDTAAIKADVTVVKSDVATIKSNVAGVKSKTDLIGSTTDTGGSTTAGTVMGKLNKLISDSGSTSTVPIMAEIEKTKVSDILGTISEKLNYLITQNASAITTTASDTEQDVVVSQEVSTTEDELVLATFTPLVGGALRLKAMLKVAGSSYNTNGNIKIYKNTSSLTSVKTSEKQYTSVQTDFNIEVGSTYKIVLYSSAATVTAFCNSLTLNYTVNQPKSLLGL